MMIGYIALTFSYSSLSSESSLLVGISSSSVSSSTCLFVVICVVAAVAIIAVVSEMVSPLAAYALSCG